MVYYFLLSLTIHLLYDVLASASTISCNFNWSLRFPLLEQTVMPVYLTNLHLNTLYVLVGSENK